MSHEQLRYVLDNASDFLQDVEEDYVPETKKPHFEDWNPQPDGGAFGSTDELDLIDKILDNLNPQLRLIDSMIEKIASSAIPTFDNPPDKISPDSKKIWSSLLGDKDFLKHLRSRSPSEQWSLSEYIFTLHALKAGKTPFSDWDQDSAQEFKERDEKIRLNLKKKEEFKKKTGETPERFHQRTGKCPKDFVWKESRRRCLYKKLSKICQ